MSVDPHATEFEELIAQPKRAALERYINAYKRHRAEKTPEAFADFEKECVSYYRGVFKTYAGGSTPCPKCMEILLQHEKGKI